MSGALSAMAAQPTPAAAQAAPACPPARPARTADAGFAQLLGQSRAGQAPPAGPTEPQPAKPATPQRPHNAKPEGSREDARSVPDPSAAEPAAPTAESPAEGQAEGQAETEDTDETAATKALGDPDLSGLLPGWQPMPVAVAAAAAASKQASPADATQAVGAAALLPAQAAPFEAGSQTESEADAAGDASPSGEPAQAVAASAALPTPAAAPATPTASDGLGVVPALQTLPAPSAPPAPPPSVVLDLPIPPHSPAFAPALATQLRWLVQDGVQSAQLRLNPQEMGPVAVQIVIDGREARIDFSAEVAATRSVLEASLPVLAAALDESGLKLTGGGVHDGAASRHGTPGQQARAGLPSSAQSGGEHAAAPASGPAPKHSRGLVDLVA
jgi:flagellar hook-length control protein FliK